MRQIHIGERRTRVAEDVRASLTALGRGDADIGGIALVGVTPAGAAQPFDAVLVVPRGVLIVAGVDLPGPAMHLHAPLEDQWAADNWPLVGSGDAVNPGSTALAAADELAGRLNAQLAGTLPVAALLAVGPYVDGVTGSGSDAHQPVRIAYPTPANLREVIASVFPADRPACTVEQARAVLRLIAPDVPVQTDGGLAREGFVPARVSADTRRIEHATVFPPVPQPPRDLSEERPSVRLRLLPVAAAALLVIGIIIAIVLAAGGATGSQPGNERAAPVRHTVGGVEYTEVARAGESACGEFTFGDVQALLEREPCAAISLGSFSAERGPRRAAVSVAAIHLAGDRQAAAVKRLADTPGAGGAVDIAAERGTWPDATPTFADAAYRTDLDGSTVRISRAVWLDAASTPDDAELRRLAANAFALPLIE